MISTRLLQNLPNIDELKKLCQSIAMLDAILEPEWSLRYYSFNSKWSEGERMASMRDGSGDSYFILFSPAGAIIKGFAHEAPIAETVAQTGKPWPGVIDQVPEVFQEFLSEPAFSCNEATFCIWRETADTSWHIGDIHFPAGDDPDGSADLLCILDGKPQTYKAWAEEYHEMPVPLACVRQVYEHRPLSSQLVTELNPELTLEDLAEDVEEIGYP